MGLKSLPFESCLAQFEDPGALSLGDNFFQALHYQSLDGRPFPRSELSSLF